MPKIQKLFESFRDYLGEQELVESRLIDLQDKHPEIKGEIAKLSEADPSGKNKYLNWMVKQLLSSPQENKKDTFEEIKYVVKYFDKFIGRLKEKDINKYKTVQELSKDLGKVVDGFEQHMPSQRRSKRETQVDGATIIYDDDDFSIVRPDSEEASCRIANKNTPWCIAARDQRNYFNQYTQEGQVFYILKNKNLEEFFPNRSSIKQEESGNPGYMLAFVFEGPKWVQTFDGHNEYHGIDKRTILGYVRQNIAPTPAEKEGDLLNYKLMERANETLDQFLEIMEEHSVDNPPDNSSLEREYEEILATFNSYNPKHSSLSYDDSGDGDGFYFDASIMVALEDFNWKIDLDDYLDYQNYKKMLFFTDVIRKIINKETDLYVDEMECEVRDGVVEAWGSVSVESHSPDSMRGVAQDLMDFESKYDDIILEIMEGFAEIGFITGAPSQKAAELFNRLSDEYKNVTVELTEENQVEVSVELEVTGVDKINFFGGEARTIQDAFIENVRGLIVAAKKHAVKQLSLMERNIPTSVPKVVFRQLPSAERVVKLEMVMTLLWNDEEEKFEMIKNFADYVENHYDAIQNIFVKTFREFLAQQKNVLTRS